jgi:acyl-CoA synthetase (AMP-forming)/AMP-acid ligase II
VVGKAEDAMIYSSPYPAISVPAKSITELVFAGLATDGPVLMDGVSGESMTGAALKQAVMGFAGGLAQRGIGRGDVVALMSGNSPAFAVVFHGTMWAGATLTTANPTYTATELRHQLNDSGARMLCVPAALAALAAEAVQGTGVTETLLMDVASLADFAGPPVTAQVPVDLANDICVLPYSSGTTGLPKGVMLTQANLVTNLLQGAQLLQIKPGDTTLAILPFFHIYGMIVLLNTFLYEGGRLVTLPRFDLETSLRLIAEHRMETLMVVPPLVLALAKHPMVDQFDLTSVKRIMSAAAPLGIELATACATRLNCEVMQGYGMTEMSPISHLTPPGESRMGAVGQTVAMTESRIVDPDTLADMPPDEPGELWVRGPQVMKGYLRNPEATAKTMHGEWLRTGDLARIDADGFLWIVDRVKELIKVKGFQVAPAELEAILFGHAEIADCAVIGQPDDEAGERPVAFVVRRPGSEMSEDAVKAVLTGQVARYKELAGVRFVDSIPKTASGKILRRQLRAAL